MEKQLLDIDKMQLDAIKPNNCLNINVGVLGHVDSGKTSICKILSLVTSTASLDKNPQSQQRGITLDLGFSAFLTRVPHRLQDKIKDEYIQFTLVDCPGHASLIRTILGGAQIIDMMFLVIDITKGIQTQTAQCIIIAQLFIKNLIIVLNKVDLIAQRKVIDGKIAALRKVFAKTKFGSDLTMVQFSTKQKQMQYCRNLKEILLDRTQIPVRNPQGSFLLLIDHCFKIKGKGTVITGTVIQGKVKPGDQIQLCQIQQKTKVKSMQMFRKPINSAKQGDRIAMLMTQLQAANIERGLACTPNSLKKINRCVMDLNKIRLYKRPIKNKAKFHIISGHQTVMGQLRLFLANKKQLDINAQFLAISDYQQVQDEIKKLQQQVKKQNIKEQQMIEKVQEVKGEPLLQQKNKQVIAKYAFAIVNFQKQIYGHEGQKLIGYKYDIDNDQKQCRIAFHGVIQAILTVDQRLKLKKQKEKKGVVDRVVDNYTVIIKDLFSKQFDIQKVVGRQIIFQATGQVGRIQGPFGKSGKIKVVCKSSLQGVAQNTFVIMKYDKMH